MQAAATRRSGLTATSSARWRPPLRWTLNDNAAVTFTDSDKGVAIYALSVDASGNFNGVQGSPMTTRGFCSFLDGWENTARNGDESGAEHFTQTSSGPAARQSTTSAREGAAQWSLAPPSVQGLARRRPPLSSRFCRQGIAQSSSNQPPALRPLSRCSRWWSTDYDSRRRRPGRGGHAGAAQRDPLGPGRRRRGDGQRFDDRRRRSR